MPSFDGQWQTTRYSGNNLENPEPITLTISIDADPNNLDSAPIQGRARMYACSAQWKATAQCGGPQ